MQNKGKFVINEPCHEDWEKMTPKEQGRFCDVCAKCVVDLTNKSHEEILSAYQENEGNMCGRMTVSQLRSPEQTTLPTSLLQTEKPNKPTPSVRARQSKRGTTQSNPGHWPIAAAALKRIQIFAAAFVAVFAFVFNQQAHSQTRPIKGKVKYVKETGNLEGTVKYDYGSAAAGLKVKLLHGSEVAAETTTDGEGHYRFSDIRTGNYVITVSAYDWNMTEKAVTVRSKSTQTINLTVIDEAIDGGIWLEPIDEPIEVPEPEIIEEELMMLGDVMYIPEEGPTEECGEVAVTELPEEELNGEEPLEEIIPIEPIEIPILEEEIYVKGDIAYLPNSGLETVITEVSETAINPDTSIPVDESSQSLESPTNPWENPTLAHPSLDLTVYPNPTRGQFSGQVNMEVPQALEVTVLDMNGRILIAKTVGKQARGFFTVDLAQYADGTYILNVVIGDAREERRVIKAE